MSNLITRSVGELVEEYYIIYGKNLNSNRALPLLYDGLKPGYRRIIATALGMSGNHVKSPDLVGAVYKVHPHSTEAIYRSIVNLVRKGILVEDGNFGYYPIYGMQSPAANQRYTETGVTKKWFDCLSLILNYVPRVPGEVEGVMEPEYIGTPLPLSLVIGSRGIGIGINTNIPSFSPKSLVDAYFNNDPSLLRSYYDLEIDYDNSELDRLWNTGSGRVIYKYHVEKGCDVNGQDGVWVSGDTNLFTPDWSVIDEWKSQGLLFTRDESTGGKNMLFIGRNKGVRKINQDMIYQECLRCTSTLYIWDQIMYTYNIGIHDGKVARYISMKEWIYTTYSNYLNLVETYRQENLKQLEFSKLVQTYLKQVAEILLTSEDDITNQDIADKLGIDLEVVNAITRKSISTLKRADTESELIKIGNNIKYFKKLSPSEFTKSIVEEM